MKTLYLVRHAKSSWKNPELSDIERPLSSRGKENAPKMGMLLKKQGDIPELIISSHAKRAFDTARKIAKELDYPVRKIEKDERLYLADKEDFLEVLTEVKKSVDKVMLVSHNFGITLFANFISESDIINIPTAGIARIDFEIKKWKEALNTKGKLVFFISPKKDTNGI